MALYQQALQALKVPPMQIGQRLRQARQAKGWTLRQLADAVDGVVTPQALSLYEKNARMPAGDVLWMLATALDAPRPSWLWSEPQASVKILAFRARADFGEHRRESLLARVTSTVEAYVELLDLFHPDAPVEFPARQVVRSVAEAEDLADQLREAWDLGDAPILRLVDLLESHGVLVLAQEEGPGFNAVAGWVNERRPLIAFNPAFPIDRIRFSVAHEVGHLLIDAAGADRKTEEALAHHFAGAFLMPASVLVAELGVHRTNLDLGELRLLKQRYGCSIGALVQRAAQVGIIGKSLHERLCRTVALRGWRTREPADFLGEETPRRFLQLAVRAAGEEVKSRTWVQRYCPQAVPWLADELEADLAPVA